MIRPSDIIEIMSLIFGFFTVWVNVQIVLTHGGQYPDPNWWVWYVVCGLGYFSGYLARGQGR